MNSDAFFSHHGLSVNPFRGEEARQDSIFDRIESECRHPDFAKILGDFEHPSASIVFGERGSGKTAIRLQLAQALGRHNSERPDLRCLPVVYDDFNGILGRFGRAIGADGPDDVLREIKLVDHMDGMLSVAVPQLVDAVTGEGPADDYPPTAEVRKALRASPERVRRALVALQACYDRPVEAAERTGRLKRLLRLGGSSKAKLFLALAIVCGVLAAACAGTGAFLPEEQQVQRITLLSIAGVLLLLDIFLLIRFVGIWTSLQRQAARLSKALRVLGRAPKSFHGSLDALSSDERLGVQFPETLDDDSRYEMFARFLEVVREAGYRSVMVLVDRIDEPTIINGEQRRMRALIWPVFNNKFLQAPGWGFKLLLPLELRDELLRESSDFFREARLDKQHLVERLSWSGAMLYDLCNARYRAARAESAAAMATGDAATESARPAGLAAGIAAELAAEGAAHAASAPSDPGGVMSLFADDVTRSDVVDALDQMQQPRDAFKFLYSVVQEHCSNVTEEEGSWRISKTTLDLVRKSQVDRKEGMLRGTLPG